MKTVNRSPNALEYAQTLKGDVQSSLCVQHPDYNITVHVDITGG